MEQNVVALVGSNFTIDINFLSLLGKFTDYTIVASLVKP